MDLICQLRTPISHPLIRIKAAIALNWVLKHKIVINLVKPLLKDILTVYLQLLDNDDL